MRAVLIRQFGDPSQLKVEEVPTPVPGEGEVLVAVRAAYINPSDVKNAQGVMHGTTLPRVPGRDFAGVIAFGPADLLGREVWGSGGDTGYTRDGSHAEYILLPRAAVALKPPALSMDAAGAAGVTFITAWSAMVVTANVSRGETSVIIGAAGGVGSAAMQVAKARGSRVIGLVRSEQDAEIIRSRGADLAINAKTTDALKAVLDATGGQGAHIVFDTSGMNFAEAIAVAALDGRVPIITAPKDGMVTFNLRTLYRKTLRVQGIDTRRVDAVAGAQMLQQMTPFFESGQFTVARAEVRPLNDAPAAYADAAKGSRRIVLHPEG